MKNTLVEWWTSREGYCRDHAARASGLRFAFVKQDCQNDLYCCPPGSSPRTIVESSLMRSGPVALFSRLGADFHIVNTVDDEECRVLWQPATEKGWWKASDLEALRHKVPGRDVGQGEFARDPRDVDWSQYDVVISLDVSVPERITRNFPETVWCYYVREPKTSAWAQSFNAPLKGQDVFLNQAYSLFRQSRSGHVVDFPYCFQYFGCFGDLLPADAAGDANERAGVFVEHMSADSLGPADALPLQEYGPLASTNRDAGQRISGMSVCSDIHVRIAHLRQSKYFVHFAGPRNVWGNAAIEAVASGALLLGNPGLSSQRALLNAGTSVASTAELLDRIRWFESHPHAFAAQLRRQRAILDALCFRRPLRDLDAAVSRTLASRSHRTS